MVWLGHFLQSHPELAVFLSIGIGYWSGGFSFGAFKLGPVTGSLFAGIGIGQFAEIPVSPIAKSFLFLLFLFGIGYSVCPQFVAALKRDGLKPVALAVVTCVTGLVTAIMVVRFLGLDAGYAAGLVSGSLTESPAMGTATDAINALGVTAAETGLGLFLGGICVTTAPMIVGLCFGRYLLKMNPVLLLGGLAGSMTMTAAMAAVQVRSNSPVAVLGYTPAVPLAHILLTTWGTVIVGVMGR